MKIKELQGILKKKKIGFGLFLLGDPNISYFSGFKDGICLIIPKDKPAKLFVHRMDYNRAKNSSKVRVVKLPKGTSLFKFIKKSFKSKKIGINKNNLSLNFYKELRKTWKSSFFDLSKICFDLRKIKTKKEIELYKKACRLTDKILQKTLKNLKKLKTETEIAAFLQYETKRAGHDLSFPSIVASGINAVNAHHVPTGRMKKGFCVIDFGINYKGYCTDITRTVYVGKPTEKDKEIYKKVLGVQQNIIKNTKIGVKTADLHKSAFKALGKPFLHGLGHGIGVEIHESPNLTDKSKEKLKENMIFTIEPGHYKGKTGIRIEDDVLLTKKGAVVLTKTKKSLITY
ncbi:M24 family metallopeptidase [Nanoarchaeota archaeon]